jgi:hypothetical protein
MRRPHQAFDFGPFFEGGSRRIWSRFTSNLCAIFAGGLDGGGRVVAMKSQVARAMTP